LETGKGKHQNGRFLAQPGARDEAAQRSTGEVDTGQAMPSRANDHESWRRDIDTSAMR
jgi:hypothetical protein